MSLPPPIVFAGFGYFCAGLIAVLLLIWALLWAACLTRALVTRVRVWLAVRRRPAWIPPAPQPLKPLPRRLTTAHIEAELQRIGAEIRAELGEDFAQLLCLFADGPHTTDH